MRRVGMNAAEMRARFGEAKMALQQAIDGKTKRTPDDERLAGLILLGLMLLEELAVDHKRMADALEAIERTVSRRMQ
jgi:hypothetical protein